MRTQRLSPKRELFRNAGALLVAVAVLSTASAVAAQVTFRASVDSAGGQGNADVLSQYVAISANGRFVAFSTGATNLVSGDSNNAADVFVHDNWSGVTERVSVDSNGIQGNDDSLNPSISGDGRFVAFTSYANNLVPGDINGTWDVFVHDRFAGTTERVSVSTAGTEANNRCTGPVISEDGTSIAFTGLASNLVAGDTNGWWDIFVHDRVTGSTERVSVDNAGVQGNDISDTAAISANGRFVAFASYASNLVAGDTNFFRDIFVHDRLLGTTERVSVSSAGIQANYSCQGASISMDGRMIAFDSGASNLVAGDTNNSVDVFVHDRQAQTTFLASLSSTGVQGQTDSMYGALSGDGRFVAFNSTAANLIPNDGNGSADILLRDLVNGTTARMSVDSSGVEAGWYSERAACSADGGVVAFTSRASNLVSGDTNGSWDAFVRDRGTSMPGIDVCVPGASGVISCPCGNPSIGQDSGCDNSAATGGARITSSGRAWLGGDTLQFATAGETASATSIVLQGALISAQGVVFGQGVRCVSGVLKRLYLKTASQGSIAAPGPGDSVVSIRSTMLGDPIPAGAHRYYGVYYRDPIVLGGCAATSTFNITQQLEVLWSP